MDRSKQYLATEVLNEGRPVTYRSLSRALKVHVSLAKQMLKEFYETQNAKRPKSVNATYLLTGIRKPEIDAAENHPEATQDGPQNGIENGESMQVDHSPIPSFLIDSAPESTPEITESDEDVTYTTVMVVKEEELETTQKDFQNILSISLYSIQPNAPKDIHVLTPINDALYLSRLNEEPEEASRVFGTISNPHVKYRSLQNTISTTGLDIGRPNNAGPASLKATTSAGSNAPAPAVKPKAAPNALMSSFAKSKPPKPKPASVPVKKETPEEDATMKDVFDDDSESDGEPIPRAKRSTDPSGAVVRKAREENDAKLRAMMDEVTPAKSINVKNDEDQEMQDAPENPGSPDWPSEDDETADAALDKPKAKSPSPPVQPSGDGRRRGKRRVTKKKTFQDEKGYLVTREVEEWEEFSESEEEKPPAPKAPPKTTSFDAKKKSTTGGAMKGKGSITAFFGKK